MGHTSAAWDDFDAQGREHRRIQRQALAALKALKAEHEQTGQYNVQSFDAWSLVYSRHSEQIYRWANFERQVMLDTRGRVKDKAKDTGKTAQPTTAPEQTETAAPLPVQAPQST